MSYKLSRRDIRFMTIPYSVTNFLGITPPYHFELVLLNPSTTRKRILKHNIQVVLQMALFLAVGAYTIVKLIDERFMELFNFLDYFLYGIDTFSHYAVTFLTLHSSLQHGNWAKLNDNLQLMDRMLLRQAHRKDQTSLWRNPTIHFVLFNVVICSVLILNALFIFVDQHHGLADGAILLASLMCECTNLLMQFLMCIIVLAMRDRFVDVKMTLVENVAMLTDVLEDTVTAFNATFGWILLTLFIHNLVLMLTCINFLITTYEIYGISVGYSLRGDFRVFGKILVVWIVLGCDSAGKELKGIGKLAKELRNENKAMTSLAYCCKKLQFTAAGLVVIDRKMLFQFVSVMTTYVIVLLQLRTK